MYACIYIYLSVLIAVGVLVFQHYWLPEPSDCMPSAHAGGREKERLEVEKLMGPMGGCTGEGQESQL